MLFARHLLLMDPVLLCSSCPWSSQEGLVTNHMLGCTFFALKQSLKCKCCWSCFGFRISSKCHRDLTVFLLQQGTAQGFPHLGRDVLGPSHGLHLFHLAWRRSVPGAGTPLSCGPRQVLCLRPMICGEEDQQYPYINQRGLISAAVMSTPEIWGDTANKDAPNNLLH